MKYVFGTIYVPIRDVPTDRIRRHAGLPDVLSVWSVGI